MIPVINTFVDEGFLTEWITGLPTSEREDINAVELLVDLIVKGVKTKFVYSFVPWGLVTVFRSLLSAGLKSPAPGCRHRLAPHSSYTDLRTHDSVNQLILVKVIRLQQLCCSPVKVVGLMQHCCSPKVHDLPSVGYLIVSEIIETRFNSLFNQPQQRPLWMPTPVPDDRLVVAPLSELDLKEADSGVKGRWLDLGLIVEITPKFI